MKHLLTLFCSLLSIAGFAMTDSLITTISVRGNSAPTVSVCNTTDAINLSATIQTTAGVAYTGIIGWTTLGTGSFSDTDLLVTTYSPSSDDLAAGSVRLVLKPNCVCPMAFDTVKLVFFPPIILTNIATTNVTTCGSSNGSISLTMLQGVSPFVVWYKKIGSVVNSVSLTANASNVLIINNLVDGNYTVDSIFDARGCRATGNGLGSLVNIDKPNSPSLGGGGVLPIPATSCTVCNGGLSIDIMNGTAPFSVQLDSAGVIRTRNGLPFDANHAIQLTGFCSTTIRNIRITDANNCAMPVLQGPFQVNEPSHPAIGFDGVQMAASLSCNSNNCDGRLLVRITANQTGTGPYTIRLDSANIPIIRNNLPLNASNQVVISPLCPNIYGNVRLLDANGCALTVAAPLVGPFVVGQPVPPRVDTVFAQNFCNSATGNIKILLNTMQLGTSPYRIVLRYNISDSLVFNNATANVNEINIGNIPPRVYTSLKVTDSKGCADTYSPDFRIYERLTANVSSSGCQPFAALTTTILTGNGTYLYRWNTGATARNLANQNAGIYTVTITDVLTSCSLSITSTVAPCSSTINTTLLLNDTLQICLPVGDLPQPAFSLTTCSPPPQGTVNIISNTCFRYIANSNFVGNTQFCILQCNAATALCDTTFVNVTIYYAVPGTEIVLDTIGLNTSVTFCAPTNQLNVQPFVTRQICTNAQPNINFQLVNNCLTYTGISAGRDTACIVICDALGACDTTTLYIACYPQPRANDDSIALPVQTLTVLNITQNDNLQGLPPTSVRLLSGTQDGTLSVTSDFKITFKSSAGVCRNILPILCEICTAAGCDTTTLYIKVICEAEELLKIYTFMSPNNDGFNDEFRIDGLSKYPNAILSLYDRWGSLLLQETNYKNNWLGTFNNIPLPDGTYFYILELKDDDSTVKKGYFQIAK
jgi:gliding motility-associated-like protein